MMTNLQQATANFEALDAARIAHEFKGAAAPDLVALGYVHGWIIVNGESFNRETCFPDQMHPSFPADQGLSD